MKLSKTRLKKFFQIQEQVVKQLTLAAEQWYFVKYHQLPDKVTIEKFEDDSCQVEFEINFGEPVVGSYRYWHDITYDDLLSTLADLYQIQRWAGVNEVFDSKDSHDG